LTNESSSCDRLASRLAIVDRGRIVTQGSPDDLKRQLHGDTVQSVVVIVLSLAVGAHLHNGLAGVAVLVAVAGLLGAVFASLSNGVAVLTRQRETLIGIVTMVMLPLTFLSSALMQQSLLPGWIRWIARFNPLNWAAEAGRSAAARNADWSLIATRIGFLAALLLASAAFATRAFNAYQRSI
jgi:ABC-2 type transport system permease protein